MGAQPTGVLTPDDLNETDGRVLDVLREGRVTPQYVAGELDVSRTYASERLKRLVEHNHVARLASGLYELTDDPREDDGGVTYVGDRDPDDLVDALEAEREESDRLAERVTDLEAELEDCHEALETVQNVDLGPVRSGVRAARSALEGQRPDVDTARAELERVQEVLGDA